MREIPIRLTDTMRALAFGTGTRYSRGRKPKPTSYGYQVWTPALRRAGDEGRLLGSGTFGFDGFIRARAAALAEFRHPEIQQVQVRTNQDRTGMVWNRHEDGRISGYSATEYYGH